MEDDRKTILIVDDDPDFLQYLSTFFEDQGYCALSAKDGVEAMARVKKRRPDLITLDITMPVKSGVGFYRAIKEAESYKTIPIIIVTGVSTDFKNFISSRQQVPPPDGYLSKPVDLDELLAMARRLTG